MRYYELGGQSQWSLWVKWTVYFFFFKHCVLVFRVPELFVNSESVRSELRLQYRKRNVSAWWDDGTVEKQVWDFRSLLRKQNDNFKWKISIACRKTTIMRYTSRGLRGGHVTSMKRVRSGHCANKANLYTDFPFFPFRALQKLYQNIKVA